MRSSHDSDELLPASSSFRLERLPLGDSERDMKRIDKAEPLEWPGGTVYEGLDYIAPQNTQWLKEVATMGKKGQLWVTFLKWFLVIVIGIITGLLSFAVFYTTNLLSQIRLYMSVLVNSVNCNDEPFGCFWTPFLAYSATGAALVGAAVFLVEMIAPVASGSGVPEMKAYLNGIKVPAALRLKTLIAKMLGIVFTCSAGMGAGREEPMVHVGGIVAAGMCQGNFITFGFDTGLFMHFRNDYEKIDYVSAGVAAGLASAFGAPIGGTIFTIEYGASFWRGTLTLRSFFCAIVATFVISVLVGGIIQKDWLDVVRPGLFDFGTFTSVSEFDVELLPLFVLMGILGGVVGGLFCKWNKMINLMRHRRMRSVMVRVLETCAVGMLTVLCSFLLPYFFHQCKKLPSVNPPFVARQFYCKPSEYNDMATIFLNTPEEAIRNMFHNSGEFSNPTLFVFFFVYFAIACWTYGASVPCGLLIPSFLIGAVGGRLMGEFLRSVWPSQNIDPGMFALMGSAGMAAGVTRMTISLTVIILEAFNAIPYAVPILITVIVAKWVSDFIELSVYDNILKIRNVPLLLPDPPAVLRPYRASDIMSSPALSFPTIARVSDVVKALQSYTHNGFPVIDSQGCFVGVILRYQLIVLLQKRAFFHPDTMEDERRLTMRDFNKGYPRYPDIDEVSLTAEDHEYYLRLTPYMNKAAFVVQQNVPLFRVFKLFRTMGLRHLPVINRENEVVGMITRKDFVYVEVSLLGRQQVDR